MVESYEAWRDDILAGHYKGIKPRLFTSERLLHLTLCMLPLENEMEINNAVIALKQVESKVKKLIRQHGDKKRLTLNFPNLGYFGKPNATKVIYLEIEESTKQFELLRDIADILIRAMLNNGVIDESELSHIYFNPKTNRYENDQLHVTLMNSTFAKQRSFDAREILKFDKLEVYNVKGTTIELSTRGHYDPESGFYQSAYTIKI